MMSTLINASQLQRRDLAIVASDISKSYIIRQQAAPSDTLVGEAMQGVRRLRTPGVLRARKETFWALRDVSFEIKRGEVVGFIGRNGAGKSTLLKILSRITTPTTGEIGLRGRVGSLLEVGTGFHPELTGRENIFLNGAILGMKRREIERQFDAIVDFSGVEQFLDTPVKRFSSGMFVRLAFAVAAHLNPEILIVDEVLAVGDADFQRRCLGKMEDVAGQGRTVLFVSHNMAVMQKLCSRGIMLQNGRVTADGNINEVVRGYLKMLEIASHEDIATRTDRRGDGRVRLSGLRISGRDDKATLLLATGSPAKFDFEFSNLLPGMACIVMLYDEDGHIIMGFNNQVPCESDVAEPGGLPRFTLEIPELPLLPGRYRLDVRVRTEKDVHDYLEGATVFEVTHGTMRGRPVTKHCTYGSVFIPHRWITSGMDESSPIQSTLDNALAGTDSSFS
jgi:lipopolysaccharide transport system ATP-binding protein